MLETPVDIGETRLLTSSAAGGDNDLPRATLISAIGSGITMTTPSAAQAEICRRFRVQPFPAPFSLKVGIAMNVRGEILPLNGLRCHPGEGTSGWFIWAGEWSDDPDFFVPLHVSHLPNWCPAIVPYLFLPPGWRVLVAPGYEDVWFDEQLLKPEE